MGWGGSAGAGASERIGRVGQGGVGYGRVWVRMEGWIWHGRGKGKGRDKDKIGCGRVRQGIEEYIVCVCGGWGGYDRVGNSRILSGGGGGGKSV